MSPWLDVDFADDALASSLVTVMPQWRLSPRELQRQDGCATLIFCLWQTNHFGLEKSMKATTTLVAMSPELFGFYLLLWELLIRTQPHD